MTEPGTDDQPLNRLVDLADLKTYLREELGPAETFTVERHPEGHSNETLFVTWGDRQLVIRRPPPGNVAETAHDVLREYEVVSALQQTDVPVSETVLACDNRSIIGSDFYIVKYLDGVVCRKQESEQFKTHDHRRRIGEELVDTLAAIHSIDPVAVGLANFGHPEGFTKRQIDRWTKQLDWAFERTKTVREVPKLHEVGDWLVDNVPDSSPNTLVHGDYKLDNVMFAPNPPPDLIGVFDWELSTLGDPLTDLGWLLFFWQDREGGKPPVPELQPTYTERPGYFSRSDIVARYEETADIDFKHDQFYRTLAAYKMAGLGEMFFRRHLEGNADDPLYPVMEERVPALATYATRVMTGDEPL